MQGALFQSQHVSPAPLTRGHQKAKLSLGWEPERQTGSALLQRPMHLLGVCREQEHLQSGPQRQPGVSCVSTTLLEVEVWPWGSILQHVLKVIRTSVICGSGGFRNPLAKAQTGLEDPS